MNPEEEHPLIEQYYRQAIAWAASDEEELAIAAMLGHASVTTTGVYAKIVDKITENPARYLEELMGFS